MDRRRFLSRLPAFGAGALLAARVGPALIGAEEKAPALTEYVGQIEAPVVTEAQVYRWLDSALPQLRDLRWAIRYAPGSPEDVASRVLTDQQIVRMARDYTWSSPVSVEDAVDYLMRRL